MALLQGYLLRHKNDMQGALKNIDRLDSGEYSYMPPSATGSKRHADEKKASVGMDTDDKSEGVVENIIPKVVKSRPFRRLTVEEIDKMYFNPQEGWDKDINDNNNNKKW